MATNASGRMIWDDKARSDLLIAVFDVTPPTGPEWGPILERLRTKGYSYTASAAIQHIQKLKKKEGAGNGTGDATTPVPATPKGRKAASSKAGTPKTPSKTPRASAKKRKATELASVDDEEDYIKPQEEKDLKVEDASPSFLDDGVDYGEY